MSKELEIAVRVAFKAYKATHENLLEAISKQAAAWDEYVKIHDAMEASYRATNDTQTGDAGIEEG